MAGQDTSKPDNSALKSARDAYDELRAIKKTGRRYSGEEVDKSLLGEVDDEIYRLEEKYGFSPRKPAAPYQDPLNDPYRYKPGTKDYVYQQAYNAATKREAAGGLPYRSSWDDPYYQGPAADEGGLMPALDLAGRMIYRLPGKAVDLFDDIAERGLSAPIERIADAAKEYGQAAVALPKEAAEYTKRLVSRDPKAVRQAVNTVVDAAALTPLGRAGTLVPSLGKGVLPAANAARTLGRNVAVGAAENAAMNTVSAAAKESLANIAGTTMASEGQAPGVANAFSRSSEENISPIGLAMNLGFAVPGALFGAVASSAARRREAARLHSTPQNISTRATAAGPEGLSREQAITVKAQDAARNMLREGASRTDVLRGKLGSKEDALRAAIEEIESRSGSANMFPLVKNMIDAAQSAGVGLERIRNLLARARNYEPIVIAEELPKLPKTEAEKLQAAFDDILASKAETVPVESGARPPAQGAATGPLASLPEEQFTTGEVGDVTAAPSVGEGISLPKEEALATYPPDFSQRLSAGEPSAIEAKTAAREAPSDPVPLPGDEPVSMPDEQSPGPEGISVPTETAQLDVRQDPRSSMPNVPLGPPAKLSQNPIGMSSTGLRNATPMQKELVTKLQEGLPVGPAERGPVGLEGIPQSETGSLIDRSPGDAVAETISPMPRKTVANVKPASTPATSEAKMLPLMEASASTSKAPMASAEAKAIEATKAIEKEAPNLRIPMASIIRGLKLSSKTLLGAHETSSAVMNAADDYKMYMSLLKDYANAYPEGSSERKLAQQLVDDYLSARKDYAGGVGYIEGYYGSLDPGLSIKPYRMSPKQGEKLAFGDADIESLHTDAPKSYYDETAFAEKAGQRIKDIYSDKSGTYMSRIPEFEEQLASTSARHMNLPMKGIPQELIDAAASNPSAKAMEALAIMKGLMSGGMSSPSFSGALNQLSPQRQFIRDNLESIGVWMRRNPEVFQKISDWANAGSVQVGAGVSREKKRK